MRKKFAFLVVLVIILSVFLPSASASGEETAASSDLITVVNPEPEAQLRFSYINYCYNTISITSGRADVYNSISCSSDVDKIVISCYLQKYDNGWKTVKSWRGTYYSTSASMSHYWYVSSGYTYRVKTYFYAYSGSSSESTSCIDSEYY